jgi:hypothetical protein
VQSKEFQNVQTEFEAYMERLKEDIELKAAKFEHIDYYDALLRDGNSRDTAVAAHDVHDLDVRRKPLISVNPLFAKISDLPPTPSIEDLTYEHISLNLPVIAKNTLMELDEDLLTENYSHDEKASEIDIELSEEELPEDASETEVGQNPEENITNSLADEGGIQEVDQQEEPDGEDMAGADEMRNDETDEWLEEEGEEDAEAREDEDYEDDDKRIASFKQSLNEDEILVRVKLTDKIEKWKISDWEEVVRAGNEDKFEIL